MSRLSPVFAVLALAGCAEAVYQFPPESALPPGERATLTVPSSIDLVSINGVSIPDALEVHLTPGPLELECREYPWRPQAESGEVRFQAEAGHVYGLLSDQVAREWNPLVADLTANALVGGTPLPMGWSVSGESLASPPPSSAPPPPPRESEVVWHSWRTQSTLGSDLREGDVVWHSEITLLGWFVEGWWRLLISRDADSGKPLVHDVLLSRPSGDTGGQRGSDGVGRRRWLLFPLGSFDLAGEGRRALALRILVEGEFMRESVGVYDGQDLASFEERWVYPYPDREGRLRLLTLRIPELQEESVRGEG